MQGAGVFVVMCAMWLHGGAMAQEVTLLETQSDFGVAVTDNTRETTLVHFFHSMNEPVHDRCVPQGRRLVLGRRELLHLSASFLETELGRKSNERHG